MLKKPVDSFAGRKLGILLTDGADAALFDALVAAVEKEKGVCEVVAPKIGGVTLSNGAKVPAKQKIDGGPSVLFDAGRNSCFEGRRGAARGRFLREGFRQRCLRPLQVHRLFVGGRRPVREGGSCARSGRSLYNARFKSRRGGLRQILPCASLLAARDQDRSRRESLRRETGHHSRRGVAYTCLRADFS